MNKSLNIFLQIEKFGELFAWRVTNFFEIILKTDFDNIAKLVNCLADGNIDINHELKLLKIESKIFLILQ